MTEKKDLSSPSGLSIHTYISPRMIADLAVELKKQGVPHRSSFSHIVKTILDSVYLQWEAEHFTSTEEALSYLREEGFALGQIETPRGKKMLLKAITKEFKEEDLKDETTERAAEIYSILAEWKNPTEENE